MKKLLFIFVFSLCIASAYAQFDLSDTPFQAPKGAILLHKAASKNIKVKVGQTLVYQCKGRFAMGTDDAADELLQQANTHIYEEKKAKPEEPREQITTFLWVAKKKGKCVVFIRLGEKEDKEDRFTIEIM